LRLVASPDGRDGSVTIQQDAKLYAGLFDGKEHAQFSIPDGRRAYLHVARGDISVNGIPLQAGDAVKFVDEGQIELNRGSQAEVLLFDLP
jgi:redox-sensitive bicupin YhaK (pirin superfamily)